MPRLLKPSILAAFFLTACASPHEAPGVDAAQAPGTAATQVAADLAHAQMESIAHSDALRVVVLDPTNNRYHIALASATGTPLTHPITKAPYRITFGEGIAHTLSGVTLSASVGGDNQLKFLSYGQLDQAIDATITLSCDGFTCTLTINATSGEAVIGDIQ